MNMSLLFDFASVLVYIFIIVIFNIYFNLLLLQPLEANIIDEDVMDTRCQPILINF